MHYLQKSKVSLCVLAIVGLIFYFRSFTAAMFWDDDDFILQNLDIHNFAIANFFTSCVICGRGLVDNYYRPILQIVFAIEWMFFGQNPMGYHVVSVAFHIACSWLVFINTNIFLKVLALKDPVLQRDDELKSVIPTEVGIQTQNRASFERISISFFIALIFLVHPVQTESVVYVNSLGDSLSVLFMLLGIFYFYKNKKFFVWLFGLLALLSKETAIVYFAIIMLLDYYKNSENNFLKRVLCIAKNNMYLIVTTALYFLSRITFLNFQNTLNAYNAQNEFTSSIVTRVLVFAKAISVYIGVLFYPVALRMERSIESASWGDFGVIVGLVTLIGGFVLGLYFFYKKHILGFAILFIFIPLFPTSNILVPVNGTIYEHWLYLPIVGVAGILVHVYAQFLSAKIKPQVAGFIFALVALPLLFYCSYVRQSEWQTAIIFYESTLRHAPHSLRVVNNLAMSYADAGQAQKAEDMYLRAIELDPHNAVPRYNLGNLYVELQQSERAIASYEAALVADPAFLFAYGNLINLLMEQKDYKKVVRYASQYLKYNSQDPRIIQILQYAKARGE